MNDTSPVHKHDKGYKELYSNKTVFLDLLCNLLHLDWASGITPESLNLVDKSYVTEDFSELESDLVYQVKLGDQEMIVYVLLEFQSSVDYRMPVRLLFYMVEILREYLKEKHFSSGDTKIQIPAVFPIVMYNGSSQWNAGLSLREITQNGSIYGKNLLDFQYCLIDVSHQYTETELLGHDCISSIILLLDQKTDVLTLINRLGEIAKGFDSLRSGQNRQIIEQWIKHCGKPEVTEEMVKILHAKKEEVPKMVSNLSSAWERDLEHARNTGLELGKKEGISIGKQLGKLEGKQEGKLEGKLEGRLEERKEIVRSLHQKGFDSQVIASVCKISVEDVNKIIFRI